MRLDASSDSLLLQGDPDLAFSGSYGPVRELRILILTGEPNSPLLGERSLDRLASMVEDLESVQGVKCDLDVDVPCGEPTDRTH